MSDDENVPVNVNYTRSAGDSKASSETESPPSIPSVRLETVPAYLKRFAHFVTWHYGFDAEADAAKGQKRWRKVPAYADGSGRSARSNDPATWRSYEVAEAAYLREWQEGSGGVGLGFVLAKSGPRYPKVALTDADDLVFVDLDHCRDAEGGALTAHAQEILRRFHTYAEVSPSGTGIHLYLRGHLAKSYKTADVEVYAAGRYTTLTGQMITDASDDVLDAQDALDWLIEQLKPDVPTSLASEYQDVHAVFDQRYEPVALSDEDLLDRIRQSDQGEKFRQLYDDGAWEDLFPSQSEAVASLVCMLAFWTRKDAGRVDQLFRASALFSGKWCHKWDDPRGDVTLGVCEMASAFALIDDDVYWGDERDSGDNYRRHRGPRTLGDALRDQQRDGALAPGEGNRPGTSKSKRTEAKAKKWPAPMADAAYYGVLGEIVRETEPYIEADSAALLVNWILASGIALGHKPYFQVGADRHYGVLYSVVVGHTSDSKSNAYSPIRLVLAVTQRIRAELAQEWDEEVGEALPWTTGLSTGEGLLWQIRDPLKKLIRDKDTHEWVELVLDEGVDDKRLLAFAAEFAGLLAVMYRDGNTLSPVLRDLFDCPPEARSSPKNNPVKATAPHVGLIGMITPDELRRKLREGEVSNGFVGRFLWPMTHRIKALDDPPDYSPLAREHAQRWLKAVGRGRKAGARATGAGIIQYGDAGGLDDGDGRVVRDEAAKAQWRELYPRLRDGAVPGLPEREGLAREACARSHVMVLRIALIFAALDGSEVIRPEHQTAALAVWEYCERCAAYLFSDAMHTSVANTILDALRSRGRLTRNDVVNLFNRHTPKETIQAGLDDLVAAAKARSTSEKTGGRPVEYWEAAERADGTSDGETNGG